MLLLFALLYRLEPMVQAFINLIVDRLNGRPRFPQFNGLGDVMLVLAAKIIDLCAISI